MLDTHQDTHSIDRMKQVCVDKLNKDWWFRAWAQKYLIYNYNDLVSSTACILHTPQMGKYSGDAMKNNTKNWVRSEFACFASKSKFIEILLMQMHSLWLCLYLRLRLCIRLRLVMISQPMCNTHRSFFSSINSSLTNLKPIYIVVAVDHNIRITIIKGIL